MSAPASRYAPGPWLGAASGTGVWLLADAAPQEPVAERCWQALESGSGVSGLIHILTRGEDCAVNDFALVQETENAVRVVIRGAAVVELTWTDGITRTLRPEDGSDLRDEEIAGALAAVRLLAASQEAKGYDGPLLPIGSGLVQAAVLGRMAVVPARAADPAPDTALETALEATSIRPIDNAATDTDVDYAYLDGFMEPATSIDSPREPRRDAAGSVKASAKPGSLESEDFSWMDTSISASESPVRDEFDEKFEKAVTKHTADSPPEPDPAPMQVSIPAPIPTRSQVPTPTQMAAPTSVQMPTPRPDPMPEPEPEPELEPQPAANADRPQRDRFDPPIDTGAFAPAPQQPFFGGADQPLVSAVRCRAGHLNPVGAGSCRVCADAVAPQEPLTVARPCLGRLRLSNGETYLLDRGVIFGRKPEVPVGRPGPRPNAIALTDDRDVSRSHVEIRLDGWRVLAIDLGSVNGTRVGGPNLAQRPLPPGTEHPIEPGAVLTLAPHVWIKFEGAQ